MSLIDSVSFPRYGGQEGVYNRREFLLQMTIVALLPHSLRLFDQQSSAGFDKRELQLLRAVTEMIVPAGDGMPAVTSVGGVEYLQFLSGQNPSIQEELGNFLTELDRASHAMFTTAFEESGEKQRIRLLVELEKHSAARLFGKFVSYVYEAYYTQPRVIGLIARDLRQTSVTDEDQEMLLVPVRKMRQKYLEVR